MYRLPPFSTDEWMDKKLLFDEKMGLARPQQAVLDVVAKATRERTVMVQFLGIHCQE